jgi:ppGpp synthetase/RelA/SpoT-type nucleotidyltranferase
MPKAEFTKTQKRKIEELVSHYESNRHHFILIVEQLRVLIESAPSLAGFIHSVKWRVKDPQRLKDKLFRKLREADASGIPFDINKENLFSKINDLAGFRILHLYTRQMECINKSLIDLFDEERYSLIEGPVARTWDDESRDYFKEIGIETKDSPSLYTSVHYVLETNSRTKYTWELQVRTLMEEVWGEVAHTVNYPHPSESLACREQIKVLARVTSSCTRLVDSIFRSEEEHRRGKSSGNTSKKTQKLKISKKK